MKNKTKGKLLQWGAVGLDFGAPLIATVTQFPVWVERSAGSTVSGIFVIFALISAIPIFRKGANILKSPSLVLLWAFLFATFVGIRSILDEMIIISLVGLVANLIGAPIHKYGETLAEKEDT